MPTERLLVNFFYAHPVGHAVEALHYCLGRPHGRRVDPARIWSIDGVQLAYM